MVSVQARKDQASYAINRGVSQRRACTLLSIGRSSLYYSPKIPVKDAPVIAAMRKLSGMYPRFGYRRIQIFLQRDGIQLGKDRCGRLWSKAGLQVPKKRRRRRAGSALRPLAPTSRNSVWSYDFVYDACANGQKLKCLTVVDEYTRDDVLSRLMRTHGVPRYLRSDNGPEFVSKALLEWATKESLQLALIEPGKSWQNGTNESFNGKFRDECLSMEWLKPNLHHHAICIEKIINY